MSKKRKNNNKQNTPVVTGNETPLDVEEVVRAGEEAVRDLEEEAETTEEELQEEERIAFRRKRVKRIKYILVLLLIIFLLIPNILCGFLIFKLQQMNQNMEALKEEIQLSKAEIEKRSKQSAAGSVDEFGNLINPGDANATSQNGLENLTLLHLSDEQKYPGKQLVYLTFDDGPSDYTDEILDILKEHNAKATFFVLAKDGYDAQYNRILAEGHTLAMHSYSHKYSVIYSSLDAFMDDVNSISSFLEQKTGLRPKFYRFPGGSSNDVSNTNVQDMLHFLSGEGYTYYDWNVSSEDASRSMKDTNVIVHNVIGGIGDKTNSVVLMHDSTAKRTTVEALPVILETLQQKGNVEFLPITENTKQIYHVKEEAPVEESGLPEDEVQAVDEVQTAEENSDGN